MKRFMISTLAFVLILSLTITAAYAADVSDAPAPAETSQDEQKLAMSILDEDELRQMVENFIEENKGYNVKSERFSIAYTYLATGDTWFYNPDTWYYSASMYKVPLMMILAQKEANGEIAQDTMLKGLTLEKAENSILVYSNNDFAHLMLNYLGTDQEARAMYMQFSSLPEDYYDPDFIAYSYFTPRFMNDVMTTLYNNPDNFPHIIDCLKQAQPNDYFHLSLGDQYEIAQKYGSYNEFNHTTGIIYTPNPIILTVMTAYVENSEQIIAQAAQMFVDYTLKLDDKLSSYEQEYALAQQQAQEAAEAEKRQAEIAARQEQQRLEAEKQRELEEQQRLQQQAQKELQRSKLIKIAFYAALVILFVLLIILIIKSLKARKARAVNNNFNTEEIYEDYSLDSAEENEEGSNNDTYIPRH